MTDNEWQSKLLTTEYKQQEQAPGGLKIIDPIAGVASLEPAD